MRRSATQNSQKRSKVFVGFLGLGDKGIQDGYLHGFIRVCRALRWCPCSGAYSPREATLCVCGEFKYGGGEGVVRGGTGEMSSCMHGKGEVVWMIGKTMEGGI